ARALRQHGRLLAVLAAREELAAVPRRAGERSRSENWPCDRARSQATPACPVRRCAHLGSVECRQSCMRGEPETITRAGGVRGFCAPPVLPSARLTELEAELYALTHRGNPGDTQFYARQCAGVGSVLELGTGYGRLLPALLGAARAVTGLDRE